MSYINTGTAQEARSYPPTYGLGQDTPALSAGQFGRAMSHINIPSESIRLLRLSTTFQNIAQTLDNAYLDHRFWNALREKNPALKLDKNFRVASGTFQNRRILYVAALDPAGSRFITGQSVESPIGWDTIRFHIGLSHDTVGWILAVAHESAHAFGRVTAGSTSADPVVRARALVLDECAARRFEQRIVAEIRATPAGRIALRGLSAPRPVHVCDCERDWFPVAQKRTYLEEFVLGGDWEAAAKSLSTDDVRRIMTGIAAIPLLKPFGRRPSLLNSILIDTTIGSLAGQFPILKEPAAQAAFVLRVVDASWRELIAEIGENFYAWPGVKEQRLKRHARLFFKIAAKYTTKCT
jgi:hypothetical protein